MKKTISQLLAILLGLFLISATCSPEATTVYSISASPLTSFGTLTTPYTQPAAKTVTITNNGMDAITLNPLPSPPTGYSFTASLSTLNLAPGGTATFSIRPNAGLAVGSYNATFKVTGSNGVSVTISPTFTVTSPPAAALSAGTVNRTTEANATIGFTTSQGGTAYARVQTYGSSAPTSATVKAGASLGAVPSGSTSGKAVTYATTGPWDIYVVVENSAGVLSAPLKIPAPFVGEGTELNPYQINARQRLEIMRDLVNQGTGTYPAAHYKQTGEIHLSTVDWTPIGEYYSSPFKGVYDGNGLQITSLRIEGFNDEVGLFGCVNAAGAVVKNVRLEGVSVQGQTFVGGVVGWLERGTVQFCRVRGIPGNSIYGTGNYVGGIAGVVGYYGTVKNCYVSGGFTINGIYLCCGGVAGRNQGTVQNCYTDANIGGPNAGGIVGQNQGLVAYCYATGAVGTLAGTYYGGGIAGYNSSTSYGVRNCIAINSSVVARSDGYVGRVVGSNSGTLSSNYARKDGSYPMDMSVGGVPYTPTPGANLKDGADASSSNLGTKAWYETAGNWTGGIWDFTNSWEMFSWPKLRGFPGDSQ